MFASQRTVLPVYRPLRLLLIGCSKRIHRLLSYHCNDQVLNQQRQQHQGVFVSTRIITPTIFDMTTVRMLSSSSSSSSMLSPFDPKYIKAKNDATSEETTSEMTSTTTTTKKRTRRVFVPRVAAVQLTDRARTYFKALLNNPIRSDIIGIMLHYEQSKSGEPRMVFTFNFVSNHDINIDDDEGVSLEVISITDPNTGEIIKTIPKLPADSKHDELPKLYIHHNAFLKVLGATIDIDIETNTPILHDQEGNRMDPNA
jgi:hypothetical protein